MFKSSTKLLTDNKIIIDKRTKQVFPNIIWEYIYNGFYKWHCQYYCFYNLIKKISYIENSEYNIIIKWLPDMSGIELVLNKEIYKKYNEETYKDLTRITRRIMRMAKDKSFIKTDIIDNYEHYIEHWNRPFVIDFKEEIEKYGYNEEYVKTHQYIDADLMFEKKVLRCYLKGIELPIKSEQKLYMYVSVYPDGILFDGEEDHINEEIKLLKNGKSKNVFLLKSERLNDSSEIDIEKWKKENPNLVYQMEKINGYIKPLKIYKNIKSTKYMYVIRYPDNKLYEPETERIKKEIELLKTNNSKESFILKSRQVNDNSGIDTEKWKEEAPYWMEFKDGGKIQKDF